MCGIELDFKHIEMKKETTELMKSFQERNNMSIEIGFASDGSARVREFWEEEELKVCDNLKDLHTFLRETRYKMDEEGRSLSPVVELGTCSRCGSTDAEYVEEPYLKEANGEIEYDWICPTCYEQTVQDI